MSDMLGPIGVIGAGTMGHGIAQVAAAAGYRVRITDADPRRAEDALARIETNLAGAVERGKMDAAGLERTLGRITIGDGIAETARGAALSIEAVPERMDLKTAVFAELDAAAPADALLATNTSSLSVTELQRTTSRPDRVLGLHFFNPVHINPLLEVVRGKLTSEATLERALAFAKAIGKEAVVVNDSPGFATSRLGVLLGLEAMRMVEEGVAAPEAIDRALELGYRHPMGPLRLTDLVGLDVRLDIARYLYQQLGVEWFRPPAILERMVAEGKLGRKSGEGFYRWEER